MSGPDLAGLRAAAEAATSGPWVGEPEDGDVWGPLNRERICRTSSYAYGADATFIAAASPDVVLALVERVEAAERVRDRLDKRVDASGWQPLDLLNAETLTEAEQCGYLNGLQTAYSMLANALEGRETPTTAPVGDDGADGGRG